MIAVFEHLPVKEGAAPYVAERFANSRGHVQGFSGFALMEALNIEGTGGGRGTGQHASAEPGRFRRVVRERESCIPSALIAPPLTKAEREKRRAATPQ